ncbi:hypothetical protein E1B28_010003 [Marasmius oreades]|uniref:BTB domain-containing protein n=1 Tax=Marasmius oreades TaxID=181124 RepID=A0A9P7RWF2_9AGAR|nr:uncharacterized protein E1B28_010003 [Marasmius oreades]KAG7090930.1 hypothetical protein E1B28_010003 [Marasmius oreades]
MTKGISYSTPSPSRPSSRSLGKKRARAEDDELCSSPKDRPRNSKKSKSCGSGNTTYRAEDALTVDEHYSDNGGDIYLRLPDGTHFMCHLEKLKAAGGLFEDLFSLPQPARDSETPHELPFCDIYQEIAPEQLRYALDFIYGKLKLLRRLRTGRISLHFSGALAVLKVGHLLNLPELRKAALKALHLLFPCDSDDDRWPPVIHGTNAPTDLFRRIFPIEAVNVFRQCEVPLFAPVAYYYAAQLEIDDILFGVTRPDGSIEKLSDADKSLVMKGREKLRRVRRDHTHAWLSEHGNVRGEVEHQLHGCWMQSNAYTGQSCYAFIQKLKADWNARGFFERSDCMNALPQEALDILKKDLCSTCYEFYRPKISQGVWNGWWELPGVFGFESWKVLKEGQGKLSDGWRE